MSTAELVDVEPVLASSALQAGPLPPLVLGLDFGTSGARAALFNRRGDEICGARVHFSNEVYQALKSGADVDADRLFDEAIEVIDRLLQGDAERSLQIDWVAISSFWHSLVGTDINGSAVTPLFGWADMRAASAAEQLRKQADETEFHQRTGCPFHPSYWPAKLLWLRTERPQMFAEVETWMSFAEYFQQRLFGDAAASVSMASGTGVFHQQTCDWDEELLRLIDIGAGNLPVIAPAGKTLTKLQDRYALRWPTLSSARWFPAIGDGAANNVGAGCVTPESALLMIGTSGAMRIVYEGDPPVSLPRGLWCYRLDRKRVAVGGALSDGGGVYRWLRDTLALFGDEREIEAALSAMEPDSHGLTVLPFWSGERSTGWNLSARGAILGLSSNTDSLAILRATMEGVAYRFALIAKELDFLAPDASIVAAGNALLASPCWTQIIADVLGRSVRLSSAGEASTRGAALLALEAVGEIENIANLPIPGERMFIPDIPRHEKYRCGQARQQQAYEKLFGAPGDRV